MLTQRKETVLKILVDEYVSTASPVGSSSIAGRYGLRVSPATVRNEMADLEEEGYITRPHTSAGGVPSDKGYRYYVETLGELPTPPWELQLMIRRQFTQAERDLEVWTRLAAALLAQMARNLALVTFPRAEEPRLRHMQLVSLQEFLVLLILVLQEARLHQQLLPLAEPVTAEELTTATNKLNACYGGLTRQEIASRQVELSPLEAQITEKTLRVMEVEEQERLGEPYVDGLRHLLSQPELAEGDRARSLVEALEDRRLRKTLAAAASEGHITVIIGREHADEALYPFSVVLRPYGIPGEFTGAVATIGPTRMAYANVMGGVHFLSSLMTHFLEEVYGRP